MLPILVPSRCCEKGSVASLSCWLVHGRLRAHGIVLVYYVCVQISSFFLIFKNVFERQRPSMSRTDEERKISSICWLTPKNPAVFRAGLGWSQIPTIQSVSPTWVTRTQVLEPLLTAS